MRTASHAVLFQAALMASAQAARAAEGDGDDFSEIVVTGFKNSYSNAAKMKRDNDQFSDSISSDALGRFPDLNLGEALQRVPGVQINRESSGRDATINLRGLPGSYARLTINGGPFADITLPGTDDSTPLGAFNPDIFTAITVVKSPSAADLPGGLSGNIDLKTEGALTRKDGGTLKVGGEYDDLGGYTTPDFTLSGNKHFLNGDLAVYGVIGYTKENFRRDSIYFTGYQKLAAAQVPNYSTLYAAQYPNGIMYADDLRQGVQHNVGDTFTGSGGAEYIVNDDLKVGINAFGTRRYIDQQVTLVDVNIASAKSTITPTGGVFLGPDGNDYINAFNYANPGVYASFRDQPTTQQTWGFTADADWERGPWTIKTTATESMSVFEQLQAQFDVRNQPKSGAGNGVSGSFYSGGSSVNGYNLTLNPSPAVTVTPGPWSGSGASLTNPASDVFIIAGTNGYNGQQVRALQGDVERKVEIPYVETLNTGFRYEHNQDISRETRLSVAAAQTGNISSADLVESGFTNSFFGNSVGGYLTNWQTTNAKLIEATLKPLPSSLVAGQQLTPQGFVNDPTNGSYQTLNFTDLNDIYSGYAMAKFKGEIGGFKFHGNGGFRYEFTDNTINANNYSSIVKAVIPQVYTQSYHDLLPSAMMAVDVLPDVVFRAAAYNTFVRPQARDITPATTVTTTPTGFNVAFGDVALKPYKATSYDFGLEWYNRPGGLLAVGVFRKDIKGLITTITSAAALCPANGGGLGIGTLTLNGNNCYSSVLVNGSPATVVATGEVNANNSIEADGAEFTAQENFDFLPGFWGNFGGEANWSYTTLEGQATPTTGVVLPGISRNNTNLVLYYETELYGIRLAYNYRDKYILAQGTGTSSSFTGTTAFVKPRAQLDLSSSYNISSSMTASFNAFNLTNAIRAQYQGSGLEPRQYDYDGRTYKVSLVANF